MAIDKKVDENGNPFPEDPNAQVQNPNGVGTGTGTVGPPKTYNPFDRTQFRDAWMGSGSSYGGDVGKFISDQGYDPSQFTSIGKDNGAWRLPTGEAMDLVIDKGGANKAAWTGLGDMRTPTSAITAYPSDGMSPLSASAGTGGGASSGTSSLSATSTTNPQNDQMRQMLVDMLTKRAQQGLDVNPNDSIIKGQTDAYNAAQQRDNKNYLSQAAERKGANSNITAEARSGAEKIGQNTGGFQAELMGREVTARRQEIADALQSMQGMLTNEQQMSLQMQLAQMDDVIKRLGLQQNASQFGVSSGLEQQRINSGNDQFMANFGLNSTEAANRWDAYRNPSAYPGYGG